MKKISLAIALGAFAMATTANANWYAQADLGYSKVKFTEYSVLDSSNFEPRLSIGHSFGDFRLAADYTYHSKFDGVDRGTRLTSKIYGFGLSGIYDFSTNTVLKPYAGIRLAQNLFKIKNSNPGYFSNSTESKFGYGVLAGVQYQLAPKLALNTGIEYNRLGKFNDTKVNHYGIRVGIRYDF